MNQNLFLAAVMLVCGCVGESADLPFACNLKAFTRAERSDWRQRLDRVVLSVSSVRELPNGYSFQIDPHRISFADVAQWVELEQKCCPFFTFELGTKDGGSSIWIDLQGREGVKQFIASDFQPLFQRLGRH